MEQISYLRYDISLFIRDDHPVETQIPTDRVPAESTCMILFAQRPNGAGGPKREGW